MGMLEAAQRFPAAGSFQQCFSLCLPCLASPALPGLALLRLLSFACLPVFVSGLAVCLSQLVCLPACLSSFLFSFLLVVC